jgi:nicotinate-nucleotide pyrophosphorylase (carboxylating)
MSALYFKWKKLIQAGLEEDNIAFDWTARSASGPLAQSQTTLQTVSTARFISKANGVWCGNGGLQAVQKLSAEMGSEIKIHYKLKDGDRVQPKTEIATWVGPAAAIVQFERTLINLAAFTSGIATQTKELVDAVRKISTELGLNASPRVTATRKTLPLYRDLSIEASLVGGASPHRYNLAGGLLLKENHIATSGGIRSAIESARKVAPHLLKIEIEVRNLTELKEAIDAGAEVIMLDNFTPDETKVAIALKPKVGICFEVSGGITAQNISNYIVSGIDVISVGSITHSVKALDLSLLMD